MSVSFSLWMIAMLTKDKYVVVELNKVNGGGGKKNELINFFIFALIRTLSIAFMTSVDC